MTIYEREGKLRVRYVEDKDYIVFEWEDFEIPLEDLKAAHEAALELSIERGCPRYVAECSRARDALLPEAVVWWRETWVPRMVAAGVRRIVTVLPSSTLAGLSNRDWQRVPGSGMSILNVPSLSAAEAAVAQATPTIPSTRP